MKPLSTLSPAELTRKLDKASALSSAICDEFIATGRGRERPSETVLKTDPLALKWRANTIALNDLQGEKTRRMEWHGSLKRIPAAQG